MGQAKQRVKYAESDVFAVPLEQGGYGICVVARRRGPIFLGYFFDPKYAEVPTLELMQLSPKCPILAAMCGDLDIIEGNWPKVGTIRPWSRAEWPIPLFRSGSVVPGEVAAVTFSDKNLTDPILVPDVDHSELECLQQHSLLGSGFLEAYLSRLISLKDQLG